MYSIYLFLLGSAIVSNSILMYLLFRYGHKNTAIKSFFVFLLLINIWIAPKFITNAFHAQGSLFEILSRVSALGYVFVPVVFIIFALSYGVYFKLFESMAFWILLFIPAIIFLFLSWTTNDIGVHDFSTATLYPWGYETPTGRYYSLYVFWVDTLSLIAIGVLVRFYRSIQDQVKKKQAFFVILSIIIPLVIGTITNGVLPLLDIFIFPMGIVLANIMSIIIVYAIFKYGLFVVRPLDILSSINHAIITIDNRGNIQQMNPFAEKILHVKLSSVIGSDLKDILHIKNKNRKNNQFNNLLRQVLNNGKSKTFNTYSIMNKKRMVFPFSISITPIYADDVIVGANIFMRDTQKETKREKQKEDFFSILSHELKTPVTSLKLYNQMLLDKNSDTNESQRAILLKMASQIDNINRLNKDFYELVTVQSGKLQTEKEYFGMDDFVQSIIETMKITYKNRYIQLQGRTECVVLADKGRIEQVLINLINNAIKYSKARDKILITLSADESNVEVGVKDFGYGIRAEHQKKIFERFYRIDTASRKRRGLGIGLFIASTIVKVHGGKIWVESEEGKGSTFYFTLPHSRLAGGKNINLSGDYQLSYQ
jgi:PAS domain S-box-containing protein